MGDLETDAAVCCTVLVLRFGSGAPTVHTASNEDDLFCDVCHVDVLLQGKWAVVKEDRLIWHEPASRERRYALIVQFKHVCLFTMLGAGV